jgi:arylsulfatase A-like enzyme
MIQRNYGQGFDIYNFETNDHKVVKSSKKWLSEIQWEEPFFLWACVVSPHWRYTPPQPFMSRFVRPLNYQSKFTKDWNALSQQKGVQGFDMMLRYRELGYTEEDAEHNRSRYDAEVAYADSLVEELVQFIEARGLMGERTILMVTADHGEFLGEHGLYFTHGIYLYDPVVHVPLLIHAPGRIPAGLRVSQVVRNIDVFPTLLALAGIPIPEEVEGVSLIPAIKGKNLHLAAFSENRPYVPELDLTPEHKHRYYIRGVRGKWKSVRKGNYFLVAIPHPEFTEYELYDVREVWKDSFSAPNRVNQLPKVFKDLQQELLQWDAKDAKKEVPLDRSEEAKEMLRSLGYL